jgi:hypothetical protein
VLLLATALSRTLTFSSVGAAQGFRSRCIDQDALDTGRFQAGRLQLDNYIFISSQNRKHIYASTLLILCTDKPFIFTTAQTPSLHDCCILLPKRIHSSMRGTGYVSQKTSRSKAQHCQDMLVYSLALADTSLVLYGGWHAACCPNYQYYISQPHNCATHRQIVWLQDQKLYVHGIGV